MTTPHPSGSSGPPGTARSTAPHLVEPELRTVTAETFTDFSRAVARGFEEEHHPETDDLDRRVLGTRSFGFAVGDRWVGTCGSLARQLVVPGGAAVATAAVTAVTVAQPYRRRGLLSRMMTHELERCVERGEPLAALWASESMIYGRFGYGPAADRALLTGTSRRLAFLPGVTTEGSVDDVPREEFLRAVRGLHDDLVRSRPGSFVRDDDVWEFALFDLEFVRRGAGPLHLLLLHAADGTVDGFATYRFKDGSGDEEGEVRIKVLV
ncbi:MAG: family N-acetyltransferase, partial [Marmoricola sp.]|nr:family N-acetyltransferase [Marmoricola sp.]